MAPEDGGDLIAREVDGADAPQALAFTQTPGSPVTAAVAIEDVLARVLPALEAGSATQGLEAGLRQLHAQLDERRGRQGGLQTALAEVQNAIDRYQAGAAEEFLPDIGVVLLAVDVVGEREQADGSLSKGSGT